MNEGHRQGRLDFRPPSVRAPSLKPGDGPLGIQPIRDGILYVPDTAEPGAPLICFLHGAAGSGRRDLRAVLAAADRYGAAIVAPDSRDTTWDVLRGGFGPDVEFVDRALAAVAERCDVDFDRLAVGGVSDGASYALSIGLTNGDMFGAIIAFSPGFVSPGALMGAPRIFVAHGTGDRVLPIDGCSRRIVPALKTTGYDVTYREFDGGHTVPPVVADAAFAWWLR